MLNWIGGLILVSFYVVYIFYMFYTMENSNLKSEFEINFQVKVNNRFISFLKLDFYHALIGNNKINTSKQYYYFLFPCYLWVVHAWC